MGFACRRHDPVRGDLPVDCCPRRPVAVIVCDMCRGANAGLARGRRRRRPARVRRRRGRPPRARSAARCGSRRPAGPSRPPRCDCGPRPGRSCGSGRSVPDRRPRQQPVRERPGLGAGEQSGLPVGDQRCGAAGIDGHHRQPAGLGLEHDLPEGVGDRREGEDVGAGVSDGQVAPAQPAQEGGRLPEPLAQDRLLGTAAGQDQMQPRVALSVRSGTPRRAGRAPSPWSAGRRRAR